MAINEEQLVKLVVSAIIEAAQQTMHDVFEVSQEKVPTNSGYLKNSGRLRNTGKGAIIEYTANYASKVHEGNSVNKPIIDTQRVYVRTHRRKDGTVIQGYWKEYKEKKVVPIIPKKNEYENSDVIFRVITEIPKSDGNPFLADAFNERIPSFVGYLEENLKKLERI